MAPRKRKAPEKKASRRKPGLASRSGTAMLSVGVAGATAFGGVVARNPSIAGGTAAFLVIFSFVSANALWYQPGIHPSPFFRTRDPGAPGSIGLRQRFQGGENNSGVTTFKIERPDNAEAANTASTPAASTEKPTDLVMQIQQELVQRGLYNGTADGVIGPRTSAAILFFEETVGMPQTGQATPALLAALKTDAKGASMVPAERPREDVLSPASDIDPVAAAILNAEKTVKTAPTLISAKPSQAVSDIDRIIQIQKGLTNIAYANVGVDGVVGDQTRAAIRHFQKHYRLPETGEPDVAVLKKLRDIGAL